MRTFFQLAIVLIMTFGLSSFIASCSKDDPTEAETTSFDNGTLDVTDPDGTLEVSETVIVLDNDKDVAKLYVKYKDPNGLYRPDLVTIEPDAARKGLDGDYAIFYIGIGKYTVKAEKLSKIVEVQIKK